MNKKSLIVLPLVSAFLFSGCATLIGGGAKQTLSISSDSSKRMKAIIKYSDGSSPQYLAIPGTVIIKRQNKSLIVESVNHDFQSQIIQQEFNQLFWLNFFGSYGGPFSSTTDYISGAIWQYDEAIIVHAND